MLDTYIWILAIVVLVCPGEVNHLMFRGGGGGGGGGVTSYVEPMQGTMLSGEAIEAWVIVNILIEAHWCL